MKKTHPGFAALLLVILLLTSCQSAVTGPEPLIIGGSGPTAPTQAETTATAASTSTPEPIVTPTPAGTPTSLPQLDVKPEALQGKSVRFYHPWSGSPAQVVDQALIDFNQQNPWGIQAKSVAPGSSEALMASLEPSMGTPDSPNLIVAPLEEINYLQEYRRTIIDLKDYTQDPTWGFTEAQRADFVPLFWQQGEVSGRTYAVPAQRTFQVLFYNQSWARELGFPDAPTTADDFRAQACAAAKAIQTDASAENDGTGGWIVNTDALTAASWLSSFGLDPFPGADGKAYRFDVPETRSAFQFLRKMFDDGCAWVSRLPTPYDYFANRQALFYSGTTADIRIEKNAMQRAASGDEWTVIPYPTASESSSEASPFKPVILASGTSYAILASEKEEQMAAWLLLRWLSQPTYQAALAQAGGTVPVGAKAAEALASAAQQTPQWAQTFSWESIARPAPVQGSWYRARDILEDAFWQSFQSVYIKPEQIPDLLKTLDATIPEILEKNR